MKIQKYFLLQNKKIKSWLKYWLFLKSKAKKVVNLFVLPEATTSAGIEYTINDDKTINLKGTSTAATTFIIYKDLAETGIENGKKYTLSASQPLTNGLEIRVECYNNTSWQRHLIGSILNSTVQTYTGTANTTNTTRLRFMIYVNNAITLNIENLLIKLEEA